MGFDQGQFNADIQRRIKEHQERLKNLSDGKLMDAHMSFYGTPEREQDAALMAATYNEVRRRFVAAGWFWRRWLKRHEYEEWIDHNKRVHAKATRQAMEFLHERGYEGDIG